MTGIQSEINCGKYKGMDEYPVIKTPTDDIWEEEEFGKNLVG